MAARSWALIYAACLLSFSDAATCQSAKDYLLSAQRSGVIQFRDPLTLDVVDSVYVDLPAGGAGLSGIFVSPNGRMLYVEGPARGIPDGRGGCCSLYSIELPDLQTRFAAGIWGSNSRRRFVNAGPSLLASVPDAAMPATQVEGDRWQMSPDGRWCAGLRRGPAIDFYDASLNKIVRSFTTAQSDPEWYLSEAWIKDQFYIYTTHDGSGWLWHLSPSSDDLGQPIAVPGPAPVQACHNGMVVTGMCAIGDRLIVNEVFGGKIDRREQCDDIPGGAWLLDPASKQSVMNFAPQLYFWQLIPSPDGNSLYGVTSDSSFIGASSQLVRLDAHSGRILASRTLEGDYWWLAAASLHSIPASSRTVILPVDDTR